MRIGGLNKLRVTHKPCANWGAKKFKGNAQIVFELGAKKLRITHKPCPNWGVKKLRVTHKSYANWGLKN